MTGGCKCSFVLSRREAITERIVKREAFKTESNQVRSLFFLHGSLNTVIIDALSVPATPMKATSKAVSTIVSPFFAQVS